MARKSQTRIVIETGGRPRLLFSVADTSSDGSLVIRFPELALRNPTDEQSYSVKSETHFTVHPSPNFAGNVINFTSFKNDGQTIYHRLEIWSSPTILLTPLTMRRQWKFDDDDFLNHRSIDNVISIGSFDQEFNTLVFGVWVIAKGLVSPPVSWPFRQFRFNFRSFDLLLYQSNMPIGAFADGDTQIFSTSSPRITDKDKQIVVESETMVDKARATYGRTVEKNMIWSIKRLADRYVAIFEDLKEAAGINSDEMADIKRHINMVGSIAVPGDNDQTDFQGYAEGSRVKAPSIRFRFRLVSRV